MQKHRKLQRIAQIHEDQKNTSKAIEYYHMIIKNYPNVEFTGFENNYWIDIRSAEKIVNLLESFPEKLTIEANKILKEIKNPAVRLVGYKGLITSLLHKGQETEAEKVLAKAIQEIPSEERTYFKTVFDHTALLLGSFIYTYVEKVYKPEKAISFCEHMIQKITHKKLTSNLNYAKAYAMDLSNMGKKETIEIYEKAQNENELDFIYNKRKSYFHNNKFYASRLEEIRSFNEFRAIVTEEVLVNKTPKHESPSTFSLKKDEIVNVLYENPPFIDGIWVKIETSNKKIGWIENHFIRPYNIPSLPKK